MKQKEIQKSGTHCIETLIGCRSNVYQHFQRCLYCRLATWDGGTRVKAYNSLLAGSLLFNARTHFFTIYIDERERIKQDCRRPLPPVIRPRQ
jgi:hypothetical protein